jgi:hypothetical protein
MNVSKPERNEALSATLNTDSEYSLSFFFIQPIIQISAIANRKEASGAVVHVLSVALITLKLIDS